MKKILLYTVIAAFLGACTPDELSVIDLSGQQSEVKRIELRADHETLLPDGHATMKFQVVAYGQKSVYSVYVENKQHYYKPDSLIEYQIPEDVLSLEGLKLYDETGKEIKNLSYSTDSETSGSVKYFQAKFGDIESNQLKVTLRPLPNENYEEVVIPVIFHLFVPHTSQGPSFDVTTAYLEQMLERANQIFNRKITTDPNGGNAKVVFRLAEYDANGMRLQSKGKNVINLSSTETPLQTATFKIRLAAYKDLVKSKKVFWDPNKYLNVWLCYLTNSGDTYGGYSGSAKGPQYVTSEEAKASIPGFTFKVASSITAANITDYAYCGAFLNYKSFLNPTSQQGSNTFELAAYFGNYLGLMSTDQNINEDEIDGDNDYCADTYYYYGPNNELVRKNTRLYKEDINATYTWFTSYNVMDSFSQKNSISVDQVARIRKVLELCPDRWCYKSSFAFTGK